MPGFANDCTCDGCTRQRRIDGEDPTTNFSRCEDCGDRFDRNRSNSFYVCDYCDERANCGECGYRECECCPDCGNQYCSCSEDSGGGAYVNGYSYVPDPLRFHDTGEDDPDAERLHFGFELEVPSSQCGNLATSIYDGPGQQEDLLYCKEDGSISGVEIVSHPMTHKFFYERFPFEIFKPGSDQTQYLRGTPDNGYGLHVHVSRKGFRSEAHTLRWLLLIYRNRDWMANLARRESNEWSSYSDADHCVAKAKNKAPVSAADRRYSIDRYGYDQWADQVYSGARYSAVNANNRATFEVRLFRSTWDEQEFRAAVDFCHASVKYTEALTAGEALRGGLTWDSFRTWVADRPEYAYLTAELDKIAAA